MTSYEYAARQKKVAKLAGAMASVGIPATNARLMTEAEWVNVCNAVGVRVPSDETKHLVYQALEDRERPKPMTVREYQNAQKAQEDVWARF